jgi:hypothetical protein
MNEEEKISEDGNSETDAAENADRNNKNAAISNRRLKMNKPLITHDDNYGTDYHYDKVNENTRFDTNPIRWNEIWYNNEERSSI